MTQLTYELLLPNSVIYYVLPRLQKIFSEKIVQSGEGTEFKNVCGIDVSYKDSQAFGAAVVIDYKELNIVEIVRSRIPVRFPYIPGYFILREAKPILFTMRLLKCNFDALLLNGHGMLHPRKCGLASFVGVMINKPTIGVTKKLLCGHINSEYYVEINQTICGFMHMTASNKPIYISVGNRISLSDSIQLVRKLTRESEMIPEPLRLADLHSKYICKLFFRNSSPKIDECT